MKIIVIKVEENNGIFLVTVMLQCTWSDQCTKNIPQPSTTFGAIHLVSTYFRTDFSTPPSSKHMYAFRVCYCRRFVPKNYFKHNRIEYVLNNMMQMLQVNKNNNIKYNTSKIKLKRHTKLNQNIIHTEGCQNLLIRRRSKK